MGILFEGQFHEKLEKIIEGSLLTTVISTGK